MHCVVHCQDLVAKGISDKLNESFKYVIRAVNLNKSKQTALHTRLLKQLCVDNGEDFVTLVMHTEVRWMSKINCLIRFINMFESVVDFLNEHANTALAQTLTEHNHNTAYLTEFTKFNVAYKTLPWPLYQAIFLCLSKDYKKGLQ